VEAAALCDGADRGAGLRVPSTRCLLLASAALGSVAVLGCAAVPGGGQSRGLRAPLQQPMTEQWYQANAPIVREYLANLPDASLGRALDGIPLSDGTRWFEGDIYRGRRRDIAPGLTVVLLERDARTRAYLWLEEGSPPLPLEACKAGEDAGLRARRLGGALYAWRELSPDHGIVVTTCPPADWLETSD